MGSDQDHGLQVTEERKRTERSVLFSRARSHGPWLQVESLVTPKQGAPWSPTAAIVQELHDQLRMLYKQASLHMNAASTPKEVS